MKDYKKRVADQILLDKLESSGAVLIEGSQILRHLRILAKPADTSEYALVVVEIDYVI